MESLLSINKEALDLEKNDSLKEKKQHYRMTFGVYFYSESIKEVEVINNSKGNT